ncbi:MAG TPA: DUF397 domain-containing protein [Acidimicrobiales bacterium]|nr:DUF397 domain-containing protein [Acidimicrobiales bacterium]
MIWRKSTYSTNGTDCVELATDGERVYVRDSKSPDDGTVTLSAGTWRALLAGAKSGHLDDLL